MALGFNVSGRYHERNAWQLLPLRAATVLRYCADPRSAWIDRSTQHTAPIAQMQLHRARTVPWVRARPSFSLHAQHTIVAKLSSVSAVLFRAKFPESVLSIVSISKYESGSTASCAGRTAAHRSIVKCENRVVGTWSARNDPKPKASRLVSRPARLRESSNIVQWHGVWL